MAGFAKRDDMTRESDVLYWARRAREEWARAGVPADPATMDTHRKFAFAYEERLREEAVCLCAVRHELWQEVP